MSEHGQLFLTKFPSHRQRATGKAAFYSMWATTRSLQEVGQWWLWQCIIGHSVDQLVMRGFWQSFKGGMGSYWAINSHFKKVRNSALEYHRLFFYIYFLISLGTVVLKLSEFAIQKWSYVLPGTFSFDLPFFVLQLFMLAIISLLSDQVFLTPVQNNALFQYINDHQSEYIQVSSAVSHITVG